MEIFRSARQAGGVVTSPWKGAIVKYLNHLDDVAQSLQACNAVYFDDKGKPCGSSTDWIGIERPLQATETQASVAGPGNTALEVGTSGAARAAVYGLAFRFDIKPVYVVNRDDKEVAQSIKDCSQIGCSPLHVKLLEQEQSLAPPSRILGMVPDFEPKRREKKAATANLDYCLTAAEKKDMMQEMCYHPSPQTRTFKLAARRGWRAIRGSQVAGHQVEGIE